MYRPSRPKSCAYKSISSKKSLYFRTELPHDPSTYFPRTRFPPEKFRSRLVHLPPNPDLVFVGVRKFPPLHVPGAEDLLSTPMNSLWEYFCHLPEIMYVLRSVNKNLKIRVGCYELRWKVQPFYERHLSWLKFWIPQIHHPFPYLRLGRCFLEDLALHRALENGHVSLARWILKGSEMQSQNPARLEAVVAMYGHVDTQREFWRNGHALPEEVLNYLGENQRGWKAKPTIEGPLHTLDAVIKEKTNSDLGITMTKHWMEIIIGGTELFVVARWAYEHSEDKRFCDHLLANMYDWEHPRALEWLIQQGIVNEHNVEEKYLEVEPLLKDVAALCTDKHTHQERWYQRIEHELFDYNGAESDEEDSDGDDSEEEGSNPSKDYQKRLYREFGSDPDYNTCVLDFDPGEYEMTRPGSRAELELVVARAFVEQYRSRHPNCFSTDGKLSTVAVWYNWSAAAP